MAKRGGSPENLVPLTTEKARKIGAEGGKRSGEAKRERKLLSAMYADMLAKGFEVDGEKLSLAQVVTAILMRSDSASVSMLKEIREATEDKRTKQDEDDAKIKALIAIAEKLTGAKNA